jgi:hypothetical protein
MDNASHEQSVPWTLRPLDDASLGRCVPWTMRPLVDAFLGRCVFWMMHPFPICPQQWDILSLCWFRLGRTEEVQPGINYTLFRDKYFDALQGQDTSVREVTSKGRIVQGTEHLGLFVWGHTGGSTFSFHWKYVPFVALDLLARIGSSAPPPPMEGNSLNGYLLFHIISLS